MTKDPKPRLRPDRLYLGDNGRLFCGALGCAGASAHFSGRDLSGQAVEMLTAAELEWLASEVGHPARCEGCSMEVAS